MVCKRVHVLGLANSIRQLSHLACRRVSLTIYKNSNSSIILLVVYVDDIVITRVTPKVYYLSNPFFTINFTQRI